MDQCAWSCWLRLLSVSRHHLSHYHSTSLANGGSTFPGGDGDNALQGLQRRHLENGIQGKTRNTIQFERAMLIVQFIYIHITYILTNNTARNVYQGTFVKWVQY